MDEKTNREVKDMSTTFSALNVHKPFVPTGPINKTSELFDKLQGLPYNVYPVKAPDDAKNPCVIYNAIYNRFVYGVSSLDDTQITNVQIDIYADTYKENQDIKYDVILYLWNLGIEIQGYTDSLEPDNTYRTRLDVYI